MEKAKSKLRIARERSGLMQKDLAAKLGCAPANICRMESGKHPIKYSTMTRLADALEVNITDIWTQEEIDSALEMEAGAKLKSSLDRLIDATAMISDAFDKAVLDLFGKLDVRGKGDALITLAKMVDAQNYRADNPDYSEEKRIREMLS